MTDTHSDESMLGTWLRNTWQPPKMTYSSKRGMGERQRHGDRRGGGTRVV